mgnify:CR=1 FL=1
MLISLGLSVYALGLAAASRYFFGQLLVFGYHPGIIYVICLLVSLCLTPWGRQAPYARAWAGAASFFTTLTATLATFLHQFLKRNLNRSPWLAFLLAFMIMIPLVVVAVASPAVLFGYHMALARARRPFWLLALLGAAFVGLMLLRVYAAFHGEYELMAFHGIGYWLISYSLLLLTLAISYLKKPYQLPSA